ncbi:MAG TPA: DUF3667 domain-containing protein [Candidatus Udaeobacter sp.]|nr:DUF3667 domain-containing protein [Candidatus Udaeobacter sp.]
MPDELEKFVLGDTAISAIEQASPTRKGLFGRRKRQREPLTHCENCGAELQGHWCAKCGQPAIDYRRSFRHVIADLLNEFLNWDSKVFATIGLLVARPWKLTNQFLAGHRVRYVHPLRLYLLASILFFFAVNYGIKSTHFDPINLSPENRAEIRDELQRENLAPEVRAKIEAALGGVEVAPNKRAQLEQKLKREDLSADARREIQERLQHGDPMPNARTKIEDAMKDLPPEVRNRIRDSLKRVSPMPPQESPQPGQTTTEPREPDTPRLESGSNKNASTPFEKWIEARAKEKMGEHGTKMGLFIRTLFSNLPYMMLCCIPLFAFVLKILYLRRHIFYVDHLVYALHIHTFAYTGIMLIVLATIGLNRMVPAAIAGWIIALLWIAFVVQIFLSIRCVYRQGWFISMFKFLFGGFAYLIVLVFALAVTFFITVALP